MQGGEWERLQTITGTKRQQLEDFAKQKNLGVFTNKKGQVTDKDKLMEVLKAYMDDKGITGMTEKFANTFSGRMSTLSGNIKKSFAQLMGIAEDGTIKKGSLFENISKSLEKIIKSINKFAESEGAEKLGAFLGKIGDYISKFIDYCSENPDKVLTFVKAVAGFKVVETVLSPLSGLISLFGGKGGGLSGVISALIPNVSSACGSLAKLVPVLGGIGIAAMVAKSLIDKDGFIHKLTNKIGNGIAGNSKEEGNLQDYASEAVAGYGLMGLAGINAFAKLTDNKDLQRWVDDTRKEIESDVAQDSNELNGVYALTDDQKEFWYGYNEKYATVGNSSKEADYAKSQVSTPNINIHVDKIEKTADTDDIMNEVTRQYFQYSQIRNSLS